MTKKLKKNTLQAIQSGTGEHIGDLVIIGLQGRHKADDVERRLWGLGLENDVKVYRPSAINAYKRAVSWVVRTSAVDERKWTVVKLKSTEKEIIHQYVGSAIVDSQETGFGDQAVRFSHEVATRFDVDAYVKKTLSGEDLIMASDSSHQIFQDLMSEFRRIHMETTSEDLTRASVEAFDRRNGVRVRAGGGVWVFPASEAKFVRTWQKWAEKYGQATVLPVYDNQETRDVMVESAVNSVEAGLELLLEELETFQNGQTRLATLEKRIEKLDSLRDKVVVYEKVLSISMDSLKQGIRDAEQAFVDAINNLEPEK